MQIPRLVGAGRRWFQRLHPEVWILSGEERHSDLPLTVLCATETINRSYLTKLLFAPGHRQKPLGRIGLWNLRRVAGQNGGEIVLAEVHRTQRARDAHFIPVWLQS
jgi:hypothetical protein